MEICEKVHENFLAFGGFILFIYTFYFNPLFLVSGLFLCFGAEYQLKINIERMKLLLIDYVSYSGHRNFNKIHIDVLHKLGHEVYLAGRKNQFDNIELCEKNVVMEIPEMLFKELPVSSITFRLQGIFALLWTKRHIKWSDYDAVIILTYDILSFFVFRIKQKPYSSTIIMFHNYGVR